MRWHLASQVSSGVTPFRPRVRRAVILAFQPGMEALVEIGDAGQLVGFQRGQELLADGAEESFHLATPSRFPHPGMGDDQTESIEDALGLIADEG